MTDATNAEMQPMGDDEEWAPPRSRWPVYGPFTSQEFRVMGQSALALLLTLDGVISVVTNSEGNAVPAVNCNDVFYYASADCEIIPYPHHDKNDDFWQLYDWTRLHGSVGAIAWVAKQRMKAPLHGWRDKIRLAGLWALTGLPD